ncbi:hypothetical protein [Hymenobacter glacieicola]|uniref:Uncharacterized protein n=1 Tax=Hymenobacter glacieicola TaxID=1562124 RepID=A0ABQ1WK23_9BACT|nr:hypothetical protein [Hymenobacter glacieicola]GGG33312.1 hypothetical protein GCM10011378_07190 [Hymenobacter glacieicola]
MIEVYTTIEAKLKQVIPGVKDVERFFNQLAMAAQGTGYSINFPACYYELVGVRTATRSRGIQDCEGILRIRHCDQALVVSQLRTPKMEQASYHGLSGFRGGPLMTGLERVALYPDSNYRGVEVIISEYQIKWMDSTLLNKTTAQASGIEVSSEVSAN